MGGLHDFNDFANWKVNPKGDDLVLGDNRPKSKDCRQEGLMSEDQLRGVAVWIQWPLLALDVFSRQM